MKQWFLYLRGLWLVSVAACSLLAAAPQPALALEEQRSLRVGEFDRTFTVVAPDRLVGSGRPLPTLIVLHGALQTGAIIRRQLQMDEVAGRDGFMVVYPDGLGRGWNDGRRDRARERGWYGHADDVAFLDAVIDVLVREAHADRGRIYLAGVSNGGMMSLRLACESANKLAGVAAMIASLPEDIVETCKPARPLPMLVMNGTADPLVPWDGGGVGFAGGHGVVLSTQETIAFWRRVNGCSENAIHPPAQQVSNADAPQASLRLFRDCTSGAPVALIRVEGGGHRIPGHEGRRHPLIDYFLGPQSHDFETSEVLLHFFENPNGQ